MDGSQNGNAAGANSSSDFVRCHSLVSDPMFNQLTATIGAKAVQVSHFERETTFRARCELEEQN